MLDVPKLVDAALVPTRCVSCAIVFAHYCACSHSGGNLRRSLALTSSASAVPSLRASVMFEEGLVWRALVRGVCVRACVRPISRRMLTPLA
jgi:hypothetical protein